MFSIWAPKEKIDRKDYIKFVIAAFFGVALNMLAFFKGLQFTTPINGSVIMVTTPIIVLVLSVITTLYFMEQFCLEMKADQNKKRTFSGHNGFIHDNTVMIGFLAILLVKLVMRS